MFCKEVYGLLANYEVVDVKLPELLNDGSNIAAFYPMSDVSKENFALNYGGYPRSDIALIEEQQNISVARSMLEQLPDYRSADVPDLRSDAEVLSSVRSKYMQSPSEILPFIEKEIEKRDARILKDREAAAAATADSNSDVTDKNIDGL